jgi:tRNA (mo5U34)-methyltransferase
MIDAAELQRRLDAHACWYHTIDIAPGVATRGRFDLRPVVDAMPWPNVWGKRCVDVGTMDGFLAFELERRGAAEVLALAVEDDLRLADTDAAAATGVGFRLAAELIGSAVEWRSNAVTDLDGGGFGTFDIVVCGSLLSHLRDPIGAVWAMRSVTGGLFLSAEPIELGLSILGRGRPLFRLADLEGRLCPNAAGHRRMVQAAGFEIERVSRPYVVRAQERQDLPATLRDRARSLVTRAVTRDAAPGVVHRALLARPVTT